MRGVAAIIAASMLGAAASGATAEPAPDLGPAFRNTIVSTFPDGRRARLWLEPDGAYHAEGRDAGRSSGRWSIQGERICLRQRRPFPSPMTWCTEIREPQVGAVWTTRGLSGEMVRVEVVAGR